MLAIGSWTIAVATAGLASMAGGLGRVTGWSLIVSAVVFAAGHPGLTGGLAMAALAMAVIAADWVRNQRTSVAEGSTMSHTTSEV